MINDYKNNNIQEDAINNFNMANIRQATIEDITTILKIHQSSMDQMSFVSAEHDALNAWIKKNEKALASIVTSDKFYTVVAEVEGDIVGFALTIREETNLIYVLPEFQGKGVATKLLVSIESKMSSPIELKVSKNAVEFYRKHGYKIQGKDVLNFDNKIIDVFLACKG